MLLRIADKEANSGDRSSFYEELEDVEETVDEPEVKAPLSFAEILSLSKGPKVEVKKQPKSILKKKVKKVPIDKTKSPEERVKEQYQKMKYQVRSIEHKGRQLQDTLIKDKERVSSLEKLALAEI